MLRAHMSIWYTYIDAAFCYIRARPDELGIYIYILDFRRIRGETRNHFQKKCACDSDFLFDGMVVVVEHIHLYYTHIGLVYIYTQKKPK